MKKLISYVANILVISLSSCFLLGLVSGKAQSQNLLLGIAQPGEGETFYAGPDSFLYSIKITGWVISQNYKVNEVELALEVIQEGQIVTNQVGWPNADGSFSFSATINPDGYPLDRPDPTCLHCHYSSEIRLPPGPLTIRVRCADPSGETEQVERHIYVDLSGYAQVPVNVVRAEYPYEPIANLQVTGAAWLYDWRARFGSALTDEHGRAQVQVERLSQASTEYYFRVRPVVIDGVLYESTEPIRVVLSPEVAVTDAITLKVASQSGEISGELITPNVELVSDLGIFAIHLKDGSCFQTRSSSQGNFSFSNLPIGEFLILVDASDLVNRQMVANMVSSDLRTSAHTNVTLELAPFPGSSIHGQVEDATGNALPFAWVTIKDSGVTERIYPQSGKYLLYPVTQKSITIQVTAPGFYSQTQVLEPDPRTEVRFNLSPRPELKIIGWGKGEIYLPPESIFTIENNTIKLTRGWIWGQGENEHPIQLQTENSWIMLEQGTFALEVIPKQSSWLFQLEGNAMVRLHGSAEPILVEMGKMLLLSGDSEVKPVPMDPVVVRAMTLWEESPVPVVTKPGVITRFREQLLLAGVIFARIITFVIYLGVLLLLLSVPLLIIYWYRRVKT